MKTNAQTIDSNMMSNTVPAGKRRWIILAVIYLATGVGGVMYVMSFRPDRVKEQLQEAAVVQAGPVSPASHDGPAGSSEPSKPVGKIGPTQMLILMAFPLLVLVLIIPGIAFGDIYSGTFKDRSRGFWMVVVILFLTPGSLAYLLIGRRQRISRRRA